MKVFQIGNDRTLAQRLASVKAEKKNVSNIPVQRSEEVPEEKAVVGTPQQEQGPQEKKKIRKYKQK